MRIQSNVMGLMGARLLGISSHGHEGALARLSSGLRINTAADDAAGLGIATRMQARFRSLHQAMRNAMDGVSLAQTAEGAMAEVHTMLQRARELAVQTASGTLSLEDRQVAQAELEHLMSQVDMIADQTTWNGRRLLTGNTGNPRNLSLLVSGMRRGWLEQAEDLVQTHFGMTGDGSDLRIVIDEGSGPEMELTGDPDAGGKRKNIELHLNLGKLGTPTWPNGGDGPVYDDRIVARGVTQAILARNTDYSSLTDWFKEGVAAWIAGGDEELGSMVSTFGSVAVVQSLNVPAGAEMKRASGYVAAKYLDYLLGISGSDLMTFMTELRSGSTLDQALQNTIGMDLVTFEFDFMWGGGGTWALANLVDLTDSDVGGLNPGNSRSVIPDIDNYDENPTDFNIVWGTGIDDTAGQFINIQVGAETGQTITIDLPDVTSTTLGLLGVNLVTQAADAIDLLDRAIQTVSTARGGLGAAVNRLEHAVSFDALAAENLGASQSRIRDADMASETIRLTQFSVLLQGVTALMAQTTSLRQSALRTILGVS